MTLQEILSAPQAGFSGLYTPFPMSGTDMVNGAFQEEAVKDYRQQQADQAQQNLIERARAEAVRQDPTLNYVQRKIAQGLLGAKQAYDVANANGNAAGMEAASKVAQGLRKQASSIGWDSGDYGPDVSLDVAAQNMANNDTKAINNLLYGSMNPNAYYKKTMQDYIDMGANRKTAARLAQEDTEEYHSGRFNDMMDSLYMYGMDDRGAINSNGVRILSMMASEDGTSPSEIASYISKMNASPRDNWNFENSMLMTDKGLRDSLTKMAQQYQYGQQAADAAQKRRMESEERQNQQRKEYALWMDALRQEQQNRTMRQRIDYGESMGLQGDALANYVLTGKLPSAKNGETSSEGKPTKAAVGAFQGIADAKDAAIKAIQSGEALAPENNSVSELHEKIEDAIEKGHITGNDVTTARNLDYMVNFLFNKKSGNEDEAARLAGFITPNFWEENLAEAYGKQPS